MISGIAALLVDAHTDALTNVPSEAVGSGLGMWWMLVALLGLVTLACGIGFVLYLRRTAPRQEPQATSLEFGADSEAPVSEHA